MRSQPLQPDGKERLGRRGDAGKRQRSASLQTPGQGLRGGNSQNAIKQVACRLGCGIRRQAQESSQQMTKASTQLPHSIAAGAGNFPGPPAFQPKIRNSTMNEHGFFLRELRELSHIQFAKISEISVKAFSYPCPSVFIRGSWKKSGFNCGSRVYRVWVVAFGFDR